MIPAARNFAAGSCDSRETVRGRNGRSMESKAPQPADATAQERQSMDADGTSALGASKASGAGPVGLCRRRTGRSTVCPRLQHGGTPEEWTVRSSDAQPTVLRVGGACGCESCAGTHNRRFAPARRGNCLRALSGASCSLNDEERAGGCCASGAVGCTRSGCGASGFVRVYTRTIVPQPMRGPASPAGCAVKSSRWP